MTSRMQETSYPLAKRELLALDRASGALLRCASGELWITREGSQADLILKPGENWQIDADDPVVVSALCPSVLVVAHAVAAMPRIAPRRMAESVLLLVRRWQHRPLSGYPSTLLR